MTDLVETRWTRYGKDRLYVKTADGTEMGYLDLQTGDVDIADEEFAPALQACRQRWMSGRLLPPPSGPAIALPTPGPLASDASQPLTASSAPSAVSRDLSTNTAGAAARAKRDEVNRQAPVLNLVARVLGVKTEERSWRVGAKGEEMVGKQLSQLGPRWRVLHAVEVGERGSDIDHVVIGPAGVFTLNTKRHPRAKGTVDEHAVLINGQRTQYLRNSRHEGRRASRELTTACGFPVDVRSAIVFVSLSDFTVKSPPVDVHVTTRHRLRAWLESLPEVLDEATIAAIYDRARLSTTWTSRPRPDPGHQNGVLTA